MDGTKSLRQPTPGSKKHRPAIEYMHSHNGLNEIIINNVIQDNKYTKTQSSWAIYTCMNDLEGLVIILPCVYHLYYIRLSGCVRAEHGVSVDNEGSISLYVL